MKDKKMPLFRFICHHYPDIKKQELYARILCGEVYVNGEKVIDCKKPVKSGSHIQFQQKDFVSRGGQKLAHVLQKWQIDVTEKVLLDAGCSTGGFTDCLLKKGARFIYAVDVGYNQIDYRLRYDNRIKVMERTNIMELTMQDLDLSPEAAVCDLSFRSIRGAASHILKLVSPGWLIALIKPQYEWNTPSSEFRGVVLENKEVYRILARLVDNLKEENVFVSRIAMSPLKGRKGNAEVFFLLKCSKGHDVKQIKERLMNELRLQ
jgi:23S rRNA (cytidine1920-2'-O)/16S rRNA (cytidine1409-2'-O)-methyltransferase